jgi:hypothetical protein
MRLPRRATAALAVTSVALLSAGWLAAGTAGAQPLSPSVTPTGTPVIYNAAGVPAYDRGAGFSGDNGAAGKARLNTPTGVATDALGNMYFADTENNRIRKVSSSTKGIITTVAGTGAFGFGGDGGLATAAKLAAPTGVAVDTLGDIFIADSLNSRIREVTPDGKIKTFAGTGSCPDFSHGTGDGGAATSARLCVPTAVATDSGNVYIADTLVSEVQKVNSAGTISKLAGLGQVLFPEGVAADPASHNVYVGNTFGNTIVKITQPAGVVSTLASGFNKPSGVAVGSSGEVYVSDTGNNRIKKIVSGVVSNYGGTGVAGYSGDGGPALSAQIHLADSICGDTNWSSPENSLGGRSICSQLNFPTGVATSALPGGLTVFLADTANNHVRGITSGPPPVIPETNELWLLPLSAVLVAGGAFVIVRRRRRNTAPAGFAL